MSPHAPPYVHNDPQPYCSDRSRASRLPHTSLLTPSALRAFIEGEDGKRLARCFFRLAKIRGVTSADAHDATQDVLLKLVQRVERGTASVIDIAPGRLYKSSKRQAIRNDRRTKCVVGDAHEEAHTECRRHNSEEVRRAMLEAVPAAFAAVPEWDRLLLFLCDIEKIAQGEVGSWFAVSQGTVSRWLNTARRRLRTETIIVLVRQGFDRSDLPA